jgi:hypothetical protein
MTGVVGETGDCLLYLAVTFSVQRLFVQFRAHRAAIPAQEGPASFA